MSKSKLKADLSQQLNVLNEQVEKIRNFQIDADEEEKWDYDHYSSLQSKLEETLALLKDEVIPDKLDNYGDPIVSKKGILTLLDEWTEENNEDDKE